MVSDTKIVQASRSNLGGSAFQVMVCPDFPLDLITDAAEFTQHADGVVLCDFVSRT